jgi:hypothetical protein
MPAYIFEWPIGCGSRSRMIRLRAEKDDASAARAAEQFTARIQADAMIAGKSRPQGAVTWRRAP